MLPSRSQMEQTGGTESLVKVPISLSTLSICRVSNVKDCSVQGVGHFKLWGKTGTITNNSKNIIKEDLCPFWPLHELYFTAALKTNYHLCFMWMDIIFTFLSFLSTFSHANSSWRRCYVFWVVHLLRLYIRKQGISRMPWGHFLKFGTNIHLDSWII